MTSPLEIPDDFTGREPSPEDSDDQGKPKIIVDDDWKSRAQAEKEALQQLRGDKPSSGDPPSGGEQRASKSAAQDQAPGDKTDDAQTLPPPPPASLASLVDHIATQAMMLMTPPEDDKEKNETDLAARRAYARHMIDLLGVLEEKTKGNLTEDESAILAHYLNGLRMEFVRGAK